MPKATGMAQKRKFLYFLRFGLISQDPSHFMRTQRKDLESILPSYFSFDAGISKKSMQGIPSKVDVKKTLLSALSSLSNIKTPSQNKVA